MLVGIAPNAVSVRRFHSPSTSVSALRKRFPLSSLPLCRSVSVGCSGIRGVGDVIFLVVGAAILEVIEIVRVLGG